MRRRVIINITSLTVKHTWFGVGGQQQQRVSRGPGGRDLCFPTFVGICWFFRFDLKKTQRNNNCFNTTPTRRRANTRTRLITTVDRSNYCLLSICLDRYSLRVVDHTSCTWYIYIYNIDRATVENVEITNFTDANEMYTLLSYIRDSDDRVSDHSAVDEVVWLRRRWREIENSGGEYVRASAAQLFHYRADKEKHTRKKTIIRTRKRIKTVIKM